MRTVCGRGRLATLLGVLLVLVLVCPTDGFSQCNTATCGPPVGAGPGDVNGDGVVDPLDLLDLINYCFNNGAPPASLCNSEVNGWCNRFFPCQPTVGDIAQLIDFLFAGGTLASCTAASPMPFAQLKTFPRGVFVRKGINGTRTLWVSAINRGVTARRLFGYTIPLDFRGIGVTINKVTVIDQYKGPGNAWTPVGASSRSTHQVFGFAVPDQNLTSVLIPPGGSQRIIRIKIEYTCVLPFGLIRVNPYAFPPAEIPVYSTSGELAPGRALAANLDEVEFQMDSDYARIPTTTAWGQGILIALIILAGLWFASRRWRVAPAGNGPAA